MERKAVDSSNVRSIGYDADNLILEVEFKNNSVYHYKGVPQGVYDALIAAPSVGGYLNSKVKSTYPFTKVD